VANIAVWIYLKTFPSVEDTLPCATRFFDTWKTVLPWTPVSILAVLLDHTMNTHFLSPDQWHVVLTDSIWKPFHLWKALYHRLQVSSTPGKSLLPQIAVSILTISTGSSRVLHTLTIYFALLLSMSFLLCFNIGLNSFSVTVFIRKKRQIRPT